MESLVVIFLSNRVQWSLRGKWGGPTDCVAKKGDLVPWVVQVEGEESWWIGIVVGVEPRFWDANFGEWTTKRTIPPSRLITSTRGWFAVEI
jgi:hypothetical protein